MNFSWFALIPLLVLAVGPSTWAGEPPFQPLRTRRPMIEVGPKPLIWNANPAEWEQETLAWMKENGSKVSRFKTEVSSSDDDGPTDALRAFGGNNPESLGRLILRIANFAREFAGRSDPYMHSDFRAQFMREIDKKYPGFAWIVEAMRSSYEIPNQSAIREGGALGIQMPVLGSRSLYLENNTGQAVVRILPVGGNFERVSLGDNPDKRTDSPDTGIVVRPTAELQAGFQSGHFHPGLRFLVQPRLSDLMEVRMLAEVYVDIDFEVHDPMLKTISVVPRCLMDLSNDPHSIARIENPILRGAYVQADRMMSCSISAEFAFGL